MSLPYHDLAAYSFGIQKMVFVSEAKLECDKIMILVMPAGSKARKMYRKKHMQDWSEGVYQS